MVKEKPEISVWNIHFSIDHLSASSSHELEIKISDRGMIDELFYGRDETVPSGEVATSVSLSVYLWASSFCLRNAERRHNFVSAKSATWIPV